MKVFNKIPILLIFFVISTNFIYGDLSQENLENDLKYYYKISKEKNLTANDKLYILNKIYEKYKSSNLNLTKLELEISEVKKELKNVSNSNNTKKKVEDKVSNETLQDVTYKISSGDVLFIKVLPAEELSKEVVVSQDGKIVVPLIGSLKAEGKTLKELENELEKAFSLYIAHPKINITMKYFSKKQVFIMGEVRNPGIYQYREGLKLFELISQAGGLTQYAGTKNIKIYRGEKGKQKVINVNLEEVLTDVSKDIVLEPADIVEIPRQPKSISVIGAVNYPGSFEWYEGMDVLKALSLARGHTDLASLSNVKIFREKTSLHKEVISVNVNKLLKGDLTKNILLQPGDVVYIPRKFLVTGQWFVNTVLPWLTLITTIFLLLSYTK